MTKAYIVVKSDGKVTENLCVFAREGDAEHAADSHRKGDIKAWVEEVNYYGL